MTMLFCCLKAQMKYLACGFNGFEQISSSCSTEVVAIRELKELTFDHGVGVIFLLWQGICYSNRQGNKLYFRGVAPPPPGFQALAKGLEILPEGSQITAIYGTERDCLGMLIQPGGQVWKYHHNNSASVTATVVVMKEEKVLVVKSNWLKQTVAIQTSVDGTTRFLRGWSGGKLN